MSIHTPRINGQPPVYVGWDNHRGEDWRDNDDRNCKPAPDLSPAEQQAHTNLWFPGENVGNDKMQAAKARCHGCPVINECLTDALEYEDRDPAGTWGIRGGLSEADRKSIRRKRRETNPDGTKPKPRPRTHCPSGHALTERNVIYAKNYRYCAICYRATQARNAGARKARRAQNKSAA
jgi:hypothetical protein